MTHHLCLLQALLNAKDELPDLAPIPGPDAAAAAEAALPDDTSAPPAGLDQETETVLDFGALPLGCLKRLCCNLLLAGAACAVSITASAGAMQTCALHAAVGCRQPLWHRCLSCSVLCRPPDPQSLLSSVQASRSTVSGVAGINLAV